MKHILFFVLSLFIGCAAHASTPGQWDVGQQPIAYPVIGPSGTYTEQLGLCAQGPTGCDTHGGLPPFFALQGTDVPSTINGQVLEIPDVSITGSVSGTTLTVTAASANGIQNNMYVCAANLTHTSGGTCSAAISGQISGTTGGIGTYTLTVNQGTIASESMTVYLGATTGTDEFKLRMTIYGDHVLPDDPLRNHCARGASHLHEFSGATTAGACSTYAQIRNACVALHKAGKLASTNPGDDIQCSVYWHTTVIDRNPLGDGVDRVKKSYQIPIYYQMPCATLTCSAEFIDFPLGLGYVSGSNMDDPWNLRVRAAIAAANAASAAAGYTGTAPYSISTAAEGPRGDGFLHWFCFSNPSNLKDNTDDLDCPAGDTLVPEVSGAACVDGRNLYSPSGYDHVIPPVHVNATNGSFDDVCPVGWWKIPHLSFKPQFILHSAISSTVANDSPYLSSDAGYQAKARADATRCVTATNNGSSATVCGTDVNPNAATFVCKAGCSFHNDYFIGWQMKYLRRAFRKCLGIPETDPAGDAGKVDADQTVQGTACDSNTLNVGGAGGPGFGSVMQITYMQNAGKIPLSTQVDGSTIDEYYPIPVPKGMMGPATMSMNDNMPVPANDQIPGVAPITFTLRSAGR